MKTLSDTNDAPIAEINIIPFVDIILVLLIIFMVTAPFLIKTGFSLTLPGARSAEKLKSSKINIIIQANGSIFFNNKKTTLNQLTPALKGLADASENTQVVISADKNILHGTVISVINAVQAGGIKQVAIAADSKKQPQAHKDSK